MNASRREWTTLTDTQLLQQCDVDTYRASGPGGQKRNKTSSAVRIRHAPSGLIVIAEESRSQHENRAKALRRLRQAFFLKIREETAGGGNGVLAHPDWPPLESMGGRLELGRRDGRFWPAVGVVLDVLYGVQARVSDAAKVLGISTGNLIDFLQMEPKVWEQVNYMRTEFGHKLLKTQ
jgi:hypothetical protein